MTFDTVLDQNVSYIGLRVWEEKCSEDILTQDHSLTHSINLVMSKVFIKQATRGLVTRWGTPAVTDPLPAHSTTDTYTHPMSYGQHNLVAVWTKYAYFITRQNSSFFIPPLVLPNLFSKVCDKEMVLDLEYSYIYV